MIRAVGSAEDARPGRVVMKPMIPLRILSWTDDTAEPAVVTVHITFPGALPRATDSWLWTSLDGGLPFAIEC